MEILCTQRLTLQMWAASDLEEALAIWGDPQVMALLDRRGGLQRHQVEERLSLEISRQETFGVQYWQALERGTGALVGCCGLRPYSFGESGFELGYYLVPARWGLGYATEAATGVIHYAFTTLRLPQLFAGHHPHNVASRRVLIKLGFQHIGDCWYEPNGLYQPNYELLNPDHL